MSKRSLVLVGLACLAVGYLVSTVPGFDPINPFAPQPQRPVIKFLARLAKLGLWVTVFAEPQPLPPEQQYAARHCDDNKSMICHSEGW
jgi:hypothetical protein